MVETGGHTWIFIIKHLNDPGQIFSLQQVHTYFSTSLKALLFFYTLEDLLSHFLPFSLHLSFNCIDLSGCNPIFLFLFLLGFHLEKKPHTSQHEAKHSEDWGGNEK